MKKCLSIVVMFAVIFGATLIAKAASDDSYYVHTDEVSISNGVLTVPVKISNNKGFMGFSIDVGYNADTLTPVSAEKGSILSGMFNDSIETSDGNTFKVVFSSSSNISEDGVIFTLTFNTKEGFTGKDTITLSYSQQDTFNEKWEDVILNCENINIDLHGNTEGTVTVSPASGESETTESTLPATDPSTEPEPTTEPLSSVSVKISGYAAERTVDYKTTIIFYASAENAENIIWYADGANGTQNADGSFTVSKATSDFSVYFTAKDGNGNELKSETEKVTVNHNLIAKIIAFFRNIFGKLPVIEQR